MILNEKDNIAVAMESVESEGTIELTNGNTIKSIDKINFAHKVAILPISKGDKVIKYGEVIGLATEDIAVGQHVHVHNIYTAREQL